VRQVAAIGAVVLLTSIACALDIGQCEVLNQEVVLPPQFAGGPRHKLWENILCFRDTRICVPLSRSVPSGTNGLPWQTGFDGKSMKIKWLEKDSLLWISWTTLPVGNGAYIYEGNAVVKLAGEFGIEVYREHFLRSGSQGAGNRTSTRCDIACDAASREAFVTLTETCSSVGNQRSGDDSERAPLFVKVGSDAGYDILIRRVRMVERSRYKLSANRMLFQGIDASVEVLEGAHGLEDVARFLLEEAYPARALARRPDEIGADELERELGELRKMNPHLCGRGTVSGSIAFPSQNQRYIRTTEYDGAFGLAK
jgi:hypothetical protein